MLRPTPGDPWGVEQHHRNTGAEENQQLNPGGPSSRQKSSGPNQYGQGHFPILDPGLLYQASHKNTIELCKINIFYLHKISVFKNKSSNKFHFGSDRIVQFGVICP